MTTSTLNLYSRYSETKSNCATMDTRTLLKKHAIAYMQEYGVLNKFQTLAVNHSQCCWRTSSPLTPLILDFEIDLVLLFDCSRILYEKVVEYPVVGRDIFQEVTRECLKNYLFEKKCQPIGCIQLLLSCKFFSELRDGHGLFAKSYGGLSHFQRYILTSVTISRSNMCNVSTICAMGRCPDKSCPGHAGKYISMENLIESESWNICDHCGKKCYEDTAGRGVVRKVMVKFTSVMAFNRRVEKAFHTSLTCSVTDPFVKELELGDMYDIWGFHDVSVFEIWGLKRTNFSPAREEIFLSSLPPSIRILWTSFKESRPNDSWSFVRHLAAELGSNVYKKNNGSSLKMGLLLSLATLGSENCASILCVGPNIDAGEEDIMQYAANCADRNIPITFPVHGNITISGQHTWLHSGSLMMAKTGVCNVGDWESLKPAQKNDLLLVLDDGYVVTGEKNYKSTGHEKIEFLPSSLPLKTAIWTYWECKKNCDQQQSTILKNLVKVFGIPFLVDVDDITAVSVQERLELILNGGKTNPRKVPMDELNQYLRIINGITVTLTEAAMKLTKDYFVASREARKDGFPAQSFTFITTLAKAHARLALRTKVTEDDVIAIIYFYEESMFFLYGCSISTPPPFMKQGIDDVGEKMEVFKAWLQCYLMSLIR